MNIKTMFHEHVNLLKIKLISFFLIFICFILPFNFILSQHCGYSDDIEIQNYQVSNRNYTTIELRIMVYAIMNENGTKGVTRLQAEVSMALVARDFLDNYNIKLNYCIREIRSNYVYNFEQYNNPPTCDSHIYFKIHENCGLGACGQAGLGGGWGLNNHYVLMHELGHVFGLSHTFNNSHKRDESCLSNPNGPAGCAETLDQRNCNINGPKTCLIEGDGICDTPADPFCRNANNSVCPPFIQDRCGLNYPNSISSLLINNFMSYYWSGIEFTNEQKNYMHGYILAKYQNEMGDWSNCDNTPLTNVELGIIDKFTFFENETVEFKNGLYAKNCNIFFRNCLVKVSGRIELENVMFMFDHNTIFEAGLINDCTGLINSNWDGILMSNSSLLGWGGSINNTKSPAIKNNYGSSSLVWLSDVDILGNGDAINLNGNVGLILDYDCKIDGLISKKNSTPITGPFSYFGGINIYSSKINGTSQNSFEFGIDILNSNFIFENSELANFGLGISSPGGSVIINKSNFKSIGDAAIYVSDNTIFSLENSFLTNTYASVVNPTSHSIFKNNFGNSPSEGLYLSNQDDAPHSIHNNIFANNNIGIRSQGKQTGLKMLCNKMSNTSRNFNWQNDVHPIQGKDIGISSGNLFENNATHIAGSSSAQIQYNFNRNIFSEEPINIQHSKLFKTAVDLDAKCGLLGPDWTPPPALPPGCPTGIDCTKPCPVGIDCTQPCPVGVNCTIPCPPNANCTPVNPDKCPQGIDCSQPCPIGINCHQPCPPGIDCTQPCPPGIDCTQPCPLGINCYTACPAGINCTQTCPPGVNCKQPCTLPGGCYEPCFTCISHTDTIIMPTNCYDPLMAYLESKYQSLQADYVQTATSHKSLPGYSTFAGLLNNQSETNKYDIKEILIANPNMLGREEMKMMFKQSELYTESEVVQLIKLNPALLMDASIADVIFHSQSFSSASINEIKQHFDLNQNSPFIAQFALLDGKKSKVYELLDYTLYRLIYQGKNHCTDYITWLSRYETLSAKFRLIDHYVMFGQPASALTIHQAILANPNYTIAQKDDAIQYKQITDIITKAFDLDRNLNQLTKQDLEQLAKISNGETRFSKSKARGILSALYDHNFDTFTAAELAPEKIYFLSQPLIPRSFRDTEFSIYPNPAAETVHIDIQKDGNYNIDVVNVSGQKVMSTTLTKGVHTIDVKHFAPGVYYYTIQSVDGKIKNTDKLIIIK